MEYDPQAEDVQIEDDEIAFVPGATFNVTWNADALTENLFDMNEIAVNVSLVNHVLNNLANVFLYCSNNRYYTTLTLINGSHHYL